MPVIQDGQVHLTSASGVGLTLPSTVTVDTILRSWRSHVARLANGQERFVAGPFPQPFDVALRGTLYDPAAEGSSSLIGVLAAVLQDGPSELRIAGETAERFVTVLPLELSRAELAQGEWGALNVRLRSLTPYWLGDVVSQNLVVDADPEVINFNVAQGDLPVSPVFTFTLGVGASATNLKIINSSMDFAEFTVPGTFNQNEVVTVDTEAMQVYDDSGNGYLHLIDSDFLLNGYPLKAGNNTLNVYGRQAGSITLNISYRPRWA